MSDDVLNFVCIRIQSELDKFEKTKTIPHDLLDGVWTVDDIEQCIDSYDKKHQRLANRLIKVYSAKAGENLETLREALRRDFIAIGKNARSRTSEFAFPTVLSRYRSGINPIRALYYDCREMVRRYNPINDRHVWLADLMNDLQFTNRLLECIESDTKKLERLIKRYYWPITKADPNNIPLELFYAKQMIKDGRFYYQFFSEIQTWNPDE